MIEVLANGTIAVILKYINVSNQHVVNFKLTQCYIQIYFNNEKKNLQVVLFYSLQFSIEFLFILSGV